MSTYIIVRGDLLVEKRVPTSIELANYLKTRVFQLPESHVTEVTTGPLADMFGPHMRAGFSIFPRALVVLYERGLDESRVHTAVQRYLSVGSDLAMH